MIICYMFSMKYFVLDTNTGTIQQCCDAIDHLRRIIEKKHDSLNIPKKRRLPQ